MSAKKINLFEDVIDNDVIDALTDEQATLLLNILKGINERSAPEPGKCECGSTMPCNR